MTGLGLGSIATWHWEPSELNSTHLHTKLYSLLWVEASGRLERAWLTLLKAGYCTVKGQNLRPTSSEKHQVPLNPIGCCRGGRAVQNRKIILSFEPVVGCGVSGLGLGVTGFWSGVSGLGLRVRQTCLSLYSTGEWFYDYCSISFSCDGCTGLSQVHVRGAWIARTLSKHFLSVAKGLVASMPRSALVD